MATKTISVDLEAYHTLQQARLNEKESFSQVIKRGRWEHRRKTCAGVLKAIANLPLTPDEVIARLDAAQLADAPPDNHWAEE